MNAPRGSVLLADDEEKILKRLGRALRDEGHEVVEASRVAFAEAPADFPERLSDALLVKTEEEDEPNRALAAPSSASAWALCSRVVVVPRCAWTGDATIGVCGGYTRKTPDAPRVRRRQNPDTSARRHGRSFCLGP